MELRDGTAAGAGRAWGWPAVAPVTAPVAAPTAGSPAAARSRAVSAAYTPPACEPTPGDCGTSDGARGSTDSGVACSSPLAGTGSVRGVYSSGLRAHARRGGPAVPSPTLAGLGVKAQRGHAGCRGPPFRLGVAPSNCDHRDGGSGPEMPMAPWQGRPGGASGGFGPEHRRLLLVATRASLAKIPVAFAGLRVEHAARSARARETRNLEIQARRHAAPAGATTVAPLSHWDRSTCPSSPACRVRSRRRISCVRARRRGGCSAA
jgi:hypothetical protein